MKVYHDWLEITFPGLYMHGIAVIIVSGSLCPAPTTGNIQYYMLKSCGVSNSVMEEKNLTHEKTYNNAW